MIRTLSMAALALALAACGQGGGGTQVGGGGATSAACALLPDATALFGANADAVGYSGPPDIDASCSWTSADGARSGEIVTYSAGSLGAVTADAKLAEVLAAWDAQTETALAPVEGLGDGAQIATNLPGYQTQIAFRQGETLVLVMGSSGDAAMTGEAIARGLAQAASETLTSAPAAN